VKLREAVGEALRRRRQAQGRTLREVAAAAGVSLTYLSEVERGRKEASSEVLEAICSALDLILADLLYEVAETLVTAGTVSGGMPGAEPPAIVGFLPPPAAPAATVPVRATVAPVLDLYAFAGRRSA
jgi:transcriptional regulator with XRE-family HTH domain